MREHELFCFTLGMTPPWEVVQLDFDSATKRVTTGIDFPRRADGSAAQSV